MRIVTLEEHISFPEMASQIPKEALGGFGQSERMQQLAPKLADITGERLQSMDATGITMQVLSVDSSGANLLNPQDGPAFARRYNDLIAERIVGFEDRFTAFAHLPTTAPLAAADELERTVKEHHFCGAMIRGLTQDKFLDQPEFAPIFERAEKLNVPIYLHPGLPPKGVADIYYSGSPNHAGMAEALACYGWGWHSETALHVLRLLYSGVFDQYPKLNLIIGHMGEMLPMMMARSERAFKPGNGGANQRTLTDTLRQQVHITTSGFFTQPPLKIALETFGVDNILFSVDYPFSTNEMGIEFLNAIELPDEEKAKIAHGNADKLLKLRA
ncbi:amidohydrolase family protein [Mucilaginibacter aquaedulcis]|uniref:amidohydrolase family protein n=1 Tax=Mucilaginibacter aquaedulcis TaxID=1187081 RepID=UPI0025B3EFB3|nr:amidohydrolase family protein [Mucilaginibacter aquaedulcis]MDN3551648.1 amidohydrolase family protein [Mucilaginibacter aquaedulcis]